MATFTTPYQTYPYQTPQVAIPPQPQSPMIWVKGAAQAESYPVAPNATVILWDSEQDTIYIKSTDVLGKPSIKYLDYKIRENVPKTEEQTPVSVGEYATKADLASFMDEIRNKLEDLKPKSKIKEA